MRTHVRAHYAGTRVRVMNSTATGIAQLRRVDALALPREILRVNDALSPGVAKCFMDIVQGIQD